MSSQTHRAAGAVAVLIAVLALAGCGAAGHGAATIGASLASHVNTATTPARLVASATRSKHCYSSPMACGFPDPAARYPSSAYVGPHDGSRSVSCDDLRTRTGLVTVRRAGATIHDVDVQGRIVIDAPNVTIENACVQWNGSGDVDNPPAVEFEATGGRVIDSVVGGANATTQSTQIALGENVNSGYHLFADHDKLINCSECVHNDGWTVNNTYINANGRPCRGYSGTHCIDGIDHVEDIYCDTGAFSVDHDTMINPEPQTAVVFCNSDNGGAQIPCANRLTIRDSLLVGGGFTIYGCSNGVPVGSSRMIVTGNRFARCLGRPVYQSSTGGSTCTKANRASAGTAGRWPYDGYYGWEADSYCPKAGGGQQWSDNVWDENDHPVRCVQDPKQ